MNQYQLWVQRRADLVKEGNELFARADAEGRGLTAEEAARDEAINAEVDQLNVHIEREQRRRERERAVLGSGSALELSRADPIVRTRPAVADKPWGADSGKPLGEFLQAVYKARVGLGTDPRLMEAAAQGAGESFGADGGYLLMEQVSNEIMMRANTGDLLSRVRRTSMMSQANSVTINVIDETSRATGSRVGGVQAYWVDEGTAPPTSRPKFAQVTIRPHKIAALGYASDELLSDVGLLNDLMFSAFVEEIRFMVENAIYRGTGAGSPLGLLNANALVTVAAEDGQGVDEPLVYENIVKMFARCYAPARRGAVWLINQDIEPALYTMNMVIGTGGVPVFLPPNGAADAPFGTLLGRPIIPIEYASTRGTVGDIMLANLGEYWLTDKGAPQQASSIHVAFTTDETAFRVTYRVDGQPFWRSALTPFQGSDTQSPYVVLATRS